MSAPAEPSDHAPEILARGPWAMEQIRARWREEEFEPSPAHTEAADAAIRGLHERGSPSHDGVAARLVDFRQDAQGLTIELQPLRWALRLADPALKRTRAWRSRPYWRRADDSCLE